MPRRSKRESEPPTKSTTEVTTSDQVDIRRNLAGTLRSKKADTREKRKWNLQM